MKNKIIKVKKLNLGNNLPLTLIAGPCQIESKDHCHMNCFKNKRYNKQVKHWIYF
jgi:2-dehydro-3-deoxyphosphooctonate aldolase (KDO 8-P synthase)